MEAGSATGVNKAERQGNNMGKEAPIRAGIGQKENRKKQEPDTGDRLTGEVYENQQEEK